MVNQPPHGVYLSLSLVGTPVVVEERTIKKTLHLLFC